VTGSRPPAGRVVIIGAGPGEADLLTLRGARRLAEAEVVLYDALTDPALRAMASGAQWLHVGKRGFSDSTAQGEINALLIEHALAGKRVVRLKGGDPSIFGRLEEELQALADAGLEVEVVPGVSSALAAAAHTARPLTRRGSGRSVSFSTGYTRAGAPTATRTADTEVFYMAGLQLGTLAHRLVEAGWPADTPASVVSRAGWPDARQSDHRVSDLADAIPQHGGRPTIVIVGAGAEPVATSSGMAGSPPSVARGTGHDPSAMPFARQAPENSAAAPAPEVDAADSAQDIARPPRIAGSP